MKRATAAAQKKTLISAQWSHMTGFIHSVEYCGHNSTWPAVTCIRYISYRAAIVISHFIQHGGRRQESWEVLHAAEIVECIRAVMPHRIIQNPIHPHTATICY